MWIDPREALKILGLAHRQSLSQSGLSTAIKHLPTSNPAARLYDERDVKRWAVRLRRRDALVALEILDRRLPLLDSAKIGSGWDGNCPRCGDWAVVQPEGVTLTISSRTHLARRLRLPKKAAPPARAWCPKCGIVEKEAGELPVPEA
jgi:hypothetical protein